MMNDNLGTKQAGTTNIGNENLNNINSKVEINAVHENMEIGVGMSVEACFGAVTGDSSCHKRWFDGKVQSMNMDGTFNIRFKGGLRQDAVAKHYVRPSSKQTNHMNMYNDKIDTKHDLKHSTGRIPKVLDPFTKNSKCKNSNILTPTNHKELNPNIVQSNTSISPDLSEVSQDVEITADDNDGSNSDSDAVPEEVGQLLTNLRLHGRKPTTVEDIKACTITISSACIHAYNTKKGMAAKREQRSPKSR
jgi:hypothetical protein